MVDEVLERLDPRPGHTIVDGTLGGGGHSMAILPKIMPNGMLLGVELDPEMLERARDNLNHAGFRSGQFELVCGSYAKIPEYLTQCGGSGANGILIDAGICTDQVLDPGRGFSFSHSSPLDARFNQETNQTTAADIVNRASWKDLSDIIYRYGDEPRSRRIARAIVEYRDKKRIETTDELAGIVVKALGGRKPGSRIRVETRVFQAIRIAVNSELAVLEEGIRRGLGVLEPDGRMVLLSYHSGEDRIVKTLFRQAAAGQIEELADREYKILTKKPLQPTEEEVAMNARSRSAKLRAIVRVR
jgi:16S rRNA (cytosine1402-N4)-methyltransferase